MTADNWEPSEAMRKMFNDIFPENWLQIDLVKRIRPLIIAEEQPKIEAAERERIAKVVEAQSGDCDLARKIRALKEIELDIEQMMWEKENPNG